MISRKLCILSLVITLTSCQTINSDKTLQPSGRSRQPVQGEGRFIPPFVGFGGFGGLRPGGLFGGGLFPGLFGGYYPGSYYRPGGYRPGGYYQGGYPGGYYGGYQQYPRPGFGNRPYNGFGGGAAAAPSVNRPLPGADNGNNNRPSSIPNLSNLTPSQAALLGQALGAALRPLLNANGGAGGAAGLGDSGSANSLADILAQLG